MKLEYYDDAKVADAMSVEEKIVGDAKAAKESAATEGPSGSDDEAWVHGLPEKYFSNQKGPLKWANLAQRKK